MNQVNAWERQQRSQKIDELIARVKINMNRRNRELNDDLVSDDMENLNPEFNGVADIPGYDKHLAKMTLAHLKTSMQEVVDPYGHGFTTKGSLYMKYKKNGNPQDHP